jgi:hypothetical protein
MSEEESKPRRKAEQHRCYKCVHLALCGEYTICNYFENTGKLRTFPNGRDGPHEAGSDTKPCPHYERNTKRNALKTVPPFREEKKAAEEKTDRRKGVKVTWDIEKAKQMYLSGQYSAKEIAAVIGVKEHTIACARYRYQWNLEKTVKTDGRKNNGTYRRKPNHPETAD